MVDMLQRGVLERGLERLRWVDLDGMGTISLLSFSFFVLGLFNPRRWCFRKKKRKRRDL